MTPKPELPMIDRRTDITRPDASSTGWPSAETPLQRQIILWQRELLRRAEARRSLEAKQEALEPGKAGPQLEFEE
jgi:hypothetical protein